MRRTSAIALVVTQAALTGAKSHMPRKPNYGFDKRRKEQDRKAKKDAKKLDRQQRRDEAAAKNIPPGAEGEGAEQSSPLPPDRDA